MKRGEHQKALTDREEGIKGKENERLPTKLWCRHSALLYLPFERLGERRKRKKGEEGFEKGMELGRVEKGSLSIRLCEHEELTAEISCPQ